MEKTSRIPLVCPWCSYVFPGRGFGFGPNNQDITIVGSGESCPNCRRMVPIPDGRYSTDEEGRLSVELFQRAQEILRRPGVQPEQVKRLTGILQRAVETQASPEAVRNEIRAETGLEEFAELAAPKGKRTFKKTLLVLLTALSMSSGRASAQESGTAMARADVGQSSIEMVHQPAVSTPPVPLHSDAIEVEYIESRVRYYVRRHKLSAREMQAALEIVDHARERGLSPDELRKQLGEEAPRTAGILDLARPRSPSDFWTMVGAIGTCLGALIGGGGLALQARANASSPKPDRRRKGKKTKGRKKKR